MNKKYILSVLVAIFALFSLQAFASDRAPVKPDTAKLLETRQSDIWIEGTKFGADLVIGSRASLQLIYVDAPMAEAINADTMLQQWARQMVQYYGSDDTRSKSLFIAHIETFKPWDFDPTNIFIGDYQLAERDILSPSMTNPFGALDSGLTGFFAFVVPKSATKNGKEISVGYGTDSVTWTVPK